MSQTQQLLSDRDRQLVESLLDFSKFGVPKSFEDRNMISNASSNEAKTLHRKIGQMMV